LARFSIAQLFSIAAWPVPIVGSVVLAPAWRGPAIGCGTHRPLRMCLFSDKPT
jgi:hypothetical protein